MPTSVCSVGHTFCASCISDWEKQSRECPDCREVISCKRLCRPFMNTINALQVACPATSRDAQLKQDDSSTAPSRCNWRGSLLDYLEKHRDGQCLLRKVTCPLGCSQMIYACALDTHTKQVCSRRKKTAVSFEAGGWMTKRVDPLTRGKQGKATATTSNGRRVSFGKSREQVDISGGNDDEFMLSAGFQSSLDSINNTLSFGGGQKRKRQELRRHRKGSGMSKLDLAQANQFPAGVTRVPRKQRSQKDSASASSLLAPNRDRATLSVRKAFEGESSDDDILVMHNWRKKTKRDKSHSITQSAPVLAVSDLFPSNEKEGPRVANIYDGISNEVSQAPKARARKRPPEKRPLSSESSFNRGNGFTKINMKKKRKPTPKMPGRATLAITPGHANESDDDDSDSEAEGFPRHRGLIRMSGVPGRAIGATPPDHPHESDDDDSEDENFQQRRRRLTRFSVSRSNPYWVGATGEYKFQSSLPPRRSKSIAEEEIRRQNRLRRARPSRPRTARAARKSAADANADEPANKTFDAVIASLDQNKKDSSGSSTKKASLDQPAGLNASSANGNRESAMSSDEESTFSIDFGDAVPETTVAKVPAVVSMSVNLNKSGDAGIIDRDSEPEDAPLRRRISRPSTAEATLPNVIHGGATTVQRNPSATHPSRSQTPMPNVKKTLAAVRIAIGTKVHSSRCYLRYSRSYKRGKIMLTYDDKAGKRVDHGISLVNDDSVMEVKYCLAKETDVISIDCDETEEMSFLAMQVEPNANNGLSRFPNAYEPLASDAHASKRYIAIEFRSDSELRSLLKEMKKDPMLKAYATDSAQLIKTSEVEKYASSLLKDAKKERKAREYASWPCK